jgi:hypothetical protein
MKGIGLLLVVVNMCVRAWMSVDHVVVCDVCFVGVRVCGRAFVRFFFPPGRAITCRLNTRVVVYRQRCMFTVCGTGISGLGCMECGECYMDHGEWCV